MERASWKSKSASTASKNKKVLITRRDIGRLRKIWESQLAVIVPTTSSEEEEEDN